VGKKKLSKKRTSQKNKSKPSADANVQAKVIVDMATNSDKNPAAVALGRLGGLKGGPARAVRLSAGRRSEIARRAAQTRWSKHSES